MDLGLAGKVAIVTGGASGIGEATCRVLAGEGARIVLADVQDPQGAQATREITAAGGEAIYVHVDVSSAAQVQNLVSQTLDTMGTVDLLCNIAGIGWRGGSWPNIPVEDWEAQFRVHMLGTFLCTQEVARRAMIPRQSGKIVNVGSLSAHGWRGISPYSAVKAGVVGFTRNAAIELGVYGINVNVVSPGNVITPMTGDLQDPTSEFHQKVKDATLLKRVGDAKSVAPVIAFLCSEQAHYITGAEINVSAGQVLF
jgi:NAD(P)-dependent dehydrogenase (short-subunit alcohol dehydrogenase family)